jgi:glycosyltransferase involved in cell wall biosynthesis
MRKNVLIFSHGYKNGFIEASNQYSQLFDINKYNVTVVYLDGEPDEEVRNKHLAENVLFLNAPLHEKRGLKLGIIKKMLALHKMHKFHIVICHRYKPTYIMLWVAKFCRIPHLFCVMHEMNTFKHVSRQLTLRLLAQKNIILAGVSNAVRDDIKNSFTRTYQNKVITLYNVIDIASTEAQLLNQTEARTQLKLSHHDFVFGILSRLVAAKDHKTLIEAFALIKPQCPNAKLVIIGEGELKPALENQITQLGLTREVIITGFLPNAFTLLRALDVFVLSSVKEAFGRVLLEAMVAKCPIIATRTDGIPEVLGDVGMLVEKQNPLELANIMLKFYHMSAQERGRHADMGYQRSIRIFSIHQLKEVFWGLLNISCATQ